LDEFREKVSTLESLLVDAENSKQDLMEQKNQFHWNWKKSQKVNMYSGRALIMGGPLTLYDYLGLGRNHSGL
jgi:hypothetical protein